MALLQSKRVILFGIGGVGSWCAEALIRTGLTHLTIVDDDTVQVSNLNRQLPATQATICEVYERIVLHPVVIIYQLGCVWLIAIEIQEMFQLLADTLYVMT